MADPRPLDLTIQYPAPQRLDDAYAAGKQARDWQQLRVDPTFAPAEPAQPEEKPGAVSAALTAFEEYRKEAVEALLQGLGQAIQPVGVKEEQEGRMQGLRRAVIEGVMGLASTPLMAAGAAAGQTAENLSPEMAAKEVLDSGAAFTLRHLLSGAPDLKTVPPETQAAWRQPMTLREVVETATALGLPFVKGPIKGGAMKVGKILAEEQRLRPQRGSIGPTPPPEGSTFRAQPRPVEPPAEGPVPKPPEGAEARINLERIAASESVKATISDLNKFAGERLAKHRQRKGHAETVAESEAARWSLEQMLSHEPEEILVDTAKALRLHDMAVAAAEYYDTLGKQAEAGVPGAVDKLNDAFAVAVKLSALDEAQGRNLARGLEMRKEQAVAARVARAAAPEKILEISRKLGEQDPDPLLTYRRVQALRPEQRQSMLWQVYHGLRAGRDILHSAWINGLLSNPKTHQANLLATGLVIGWDIPETYVAGWVNKILFRNPEGVQRAETAIKVKALAEAYQDGIRLMGEALRTGEEPFGQGKLSERPRTQAETYGFDPNTAIGQTVDAFGAILGSQAAPTRLMMTEDAFMKGIAYRMELNALAMREALAEGKEGPALAAAAKAYQERPTAWMIEQAQDHAILLTLNKELGPFGRFFSAAMNAIPGGRIIFPFTRTPGNGLKWAGQRLPTLSLLSVNNWSDVMGNAGPAARDKAIGRVVIGNAVAAAIAWEVANGTITGPGPKDKNLAALQRDPATSTKPPFSFCPPWTNECYGYNRLDPVGAYIGAVAAWVELYNQIPDQDTLDEWTAYANAVIIAGGELGASKTWLIGVNNVLDAIKSPDGSGGKMIANFSKSIVPAGVQEVTRHMDDRILRDVRTIPDALKSGLPFLSGAVAEMLNPVTGEPTRMPPGWGYDILPIPVTRINNSRVFQEIQENRISIPPVPRSIGPSPAEGVQMTEPKPSAGVGLLPWERWRWTKIMTQEVKVSGLTLYENLDRLVHSERYQKWSTGPEGRRANEIKGLVEVYRGIALERLKAESPKLRDAIQAREQRRIDALKNPPPQNLLQQLQQATGR